MKRKCLVKKCGGFMYLDAEISDHVDIALLLKTKNLEKKNNKELLYARPMCVIGQGVD
jgi:hypothetical protein